MEAAEHVEPLPRKTAAEVEADMTTPEHRAPVEAELADVLILCLSMANRLGIDVSSTVSAKLDVNATNYPADLVRGSARKYADYRHNANGRTQPLS